MHSERVGVGFWICVFLVFAMGVWWCVVRLIFGLEFVCIAIPGLITDGFVIWLFWILGVLCFGVLVFGFRVVVDCGGVCCGLIFGFWLVWIACEFVGL